MMQKNFIAKEKEVAIMKKALFKDSIKEIKNNYKRFLSLLLMAFLGVGFFAGIRATSPDMVDSVDTYYKNQKISLIASHTMATCSRDGHTIRDYYRCIGNMAASKSET